jgi:hypothetical protein
MNRTNAEEIARVCRTEDPAWYYMPMQRDEAVKESLWCVKVYDEEGAYLGNLGEV